MLRNAYQIHQHIKKNPRWGWHELVEQNGLCFQIGKHWVISDPETVNTLLHQRVHNRKRSLDYINAGRYIPGAAGILFEEGEAWQTRLQQSMPVFTRANLTLYTATLARLVQEEVEALQNRGKSQDFYMDMTNLGLRCVLELGYGLNSRHERVQNYGKELRDYKLHTMYTSYRIDRLGKGMYQMFALPRVMLDMQHLKGFVKRQSNELESLLALEECRNGLQPNWPDLYREIGMSGLELATELNHVYGAFNAIDYTVTCGLYELSLHPTIAQKVKQELKGLDSSELANWQSDKLDYTKAFMKEVFRFYPVAIAVIRKAGEDFECQSNLIKEDAELYLLLQSLHFNPAYWENPREFNPDRFLTDLIEPKAYIPFLAGARKCIGQHLAELHFLQILHSFAQTKFPVFTGDLVIQPYFIPRLSQVIHAQYV
ncbi:MAG: cytochrome P450 [Bacteroidetes bacterium]|nr:MAG: cytochrome P450 [Bacteroidota bacterium]